MDIKPILTTLRRHKTAAALIVLEIALSCAIICNAVFLINERITRMDRPSGLAENELVVLRHAGIGQDDDAQLNARQDLAALRQLPGVKAATRVNQVPFNNSSWNSGINLTPDQKDSSANATVYLADEGFIDTFGLSLVQGRNFNADEYVDYTDLRDPGEERTIPAVLISRALAEKLFPGQDPIGKPLYSWGDEPHRVVGIVDPLIRPNNQGGPAGAYLSMVLPIRHPTGNTVIRTSPERRGEVMKAAIEEMEKLNPRRVLITERTFEEIKASYYRSDKAMVWLLISVCVALLVVTAFGIVGLASFWVQQRTKQIGVRRALGATRGQVLRYFQTENFLLASFGIAIGMLGAYGINQWLMSHYELARLPAIYLPVGAATLWLLGQIAVYGPARRAASVPPAVATRSV
ncbi:FtsX-like permease family protein [Lysobacter maris]|uniref:FtsX-like permease family protein n=1 Tax=Marilutibacter maris TaxID=1605891 RepID=A0A508B2S8_9GAMM|nr:FtsX-like permease family protein [Lysobacter maris]KAB8191031.1 FtsX-like permease family protein [Lysobacter maris]